jgi:hypothetical protein
VTPPLSLHPTSTLSMLEPALLSLSSLPLADLLSSDRCLYDVL